jgi:hypothetical protein
MTNANQPTEPDSVEEERKVEIERLRKVFKDQEAADEFPKQPKLLGTEFELEPIAAKIEATWTEMLDATVRLRHNSQLSRCLLHDESRQALIEGLAGRASRLRDYVIEARQARAPLCPGIGSSLLHCLPMLEETGELERPHKLGSRRWGSPTMVVWDGIALVVNFARASTSDSGDSPLAVLPSRREVDDPGQPSFCANNVKFRGDSIYGWIRLHAIRRSAGVTWESALAYYEVLLLRAFNDFDWSDSDAARAIGPRPQGKGKSSRTLMTDRTAVSKWASGKSEPRGWLLGRGFLTFLLERRPNFSERRVQFLSNLLRHPEAQSRAGLQEALRNLGLLAQSAQL